MCMLVGMCAGSLGWYLSCTAAISAMPCSMHNFLYQDRLLWLFLSNAGDISTCTCALCKLSTGQVLPSRHDRGAACKLHKESENVWQLALSGKCTMWCPRPCVITPGPTSMAKHHRSSSTSPHSCVRNDKSRGDKHCK